MISPRAIDAYLNREGIEDFRWLKTLSDRELDGMMSEIKPPPSFNEPLNRAQKVGFILGVAYKHWVYHLEMGCGKTRLALELLKWFIGHDEISRALVLVNSDTVVMGWQDEILRWGIGLPFKILLGSSADKWDMLENFDHGIAVATHTGFSTMVSELTYTKSAERREYVPVAEHVQYMREKFDAFVIDECFVAGTLIDTPSGKKPIESLSENDIVISTDKPRRILSVYKKRSNIITKLNLSNDEFILTTPNHPFFTDVGWVCAANLSGRKLYDITELQNLWEDIRANSEKSTTLQSILRSEIQGKPMEEQETAINMRDLRTTISAPPIQTRQVLQPQLLDNRTSRTGNCLGKKSYREIKLEQGHPDAGRIKNKIKRLVTSHEPSTISSWREWSRYDEATSSFNDSIRPGLDCGVRHFIGKKAAKLSNLLQSRYCQSDENDRNRNRWGRASSFVTKITGSKEDEEINGIRVVSIENFQFDCPQDVYSLEIEGCPHFFANGVLVHNSTRVGNSRSLSFRVCRAVMEDAPIRFALAGRLFGRDPMPVWAQFYLVDQGASFGPTINLFRGAFFTAKQGHFGGMEYKFNKKMEPQFQKFLGHRSVYFGIDEVTDLPELTKIRRMCMFPADTEVYYRRCVDEILKSKGSYREVQNAFLRMRQISSGFVGVFDDEEGETTEIEFPDNPKLDLLIELLQDLPSGRKAIVFHEFKWSGLQIAKALKKAKIVFGQLNASTKDWDQVKAKFDKSDLDLLVVSWRKGGYGLNLQAANYMFFYESPVSSLDRDQCERRIWRQGQRNRCFIYDLLMKNSVDSRIIQFHSSAANLFEALVKDPSLIEK
jgi:hypothetical protein